MIIASLLLAAAIIVADIYAVRAKSLVRAALALVLASSSLALFFFLWRAPYAASVQLSVGAGVVSTLFILAISLTESMRGGES
jgi:NADH:ubiquinone oxidoreductase subunit 6 (subunit J)